MMNATYSPDDNKLRLYASARLDRPTYDRVRGAGFRWAPAQSLFVAPMWTPEREDLLLELCGEIGDDDSSLTERAEDRADRFDGYEENRRRDAASAHAAVSRIADGIPLGQPILVGHHSERHARRDAERIENGMRRAVKMWKTAEYWKYRAAGAIRHAKYKERPDVRARRIKTIEADKRKQERAIAEARQRIRAWRLVGQPARPLPPAIADRITKDGGADTLRARALFCANYFSVSYGSSWRDLDNGTMEPRAALLAELKSNGAIVARAQRWIVHFDRRLEYERALLEADGGTVADKTGPEKGGACRCWASPRGGWSYIVKVNRVSVTVLDHWGNGGDNFTRTIEFDKLGAVMTRADVAAAKAAGRLVEAPADSKGQIQGFILRPDNPPPAPTSDDTAGSYGRQTTCPAAPAAPDLGAEIAAMADTLKAGGVKVAAVPQLFPTPAALAREVAALADIRAGMRVLEPSAGTGNLIGPVLDRFHGADCGRLVAVEINAQLVDLLTERRNKTLHADDQNYQIIRADFLTLTPADLGEFDRIVMNPPFERGADIRHIEHARSFLAPGGRLVAVCAGGPRQKAYADDAGLEWRELPAGTFADAGTNVNTAIVIADAPEGGFAAHQADDPHCTCNDCIEDHARRTGGGR